MNDRQRTALAHPCARAEETLDQLFGWFARFKHLRASIILTVNK